MHHERVQNTAAVCEQNSSVSVVSFLFQNRVKCRFLTVPKLSLLLSFNFIKPAVTKLTKQVQKTQ